MVVPEAEFECYAELEQADKNVLPYHIYYPSAAICITKLRIERSYLWNMN